MKKYVIIVEKTGTGFSAHAKDENINVGNTENIYLFKD